jgi:hypothetical protein
MKVVKNLKVKQQRVDNKLFNSWVVKLRFTTYDEIAEITSLSRGTIANTFQTQMATPKTLSILTNHFNTIEIPA